MVNSDLGVLRILRCFSDGVWIRIHSWHLHSMYQCVFEEVYDWPKECFLRIDVVVENPCCVLEVSEDSTELPKVWCTWF
ncbi:hypothetical protein B9Q02_07970 [Candidatus Marsarchaeota G1 archaeon BE_D]|uniref:Uncharacterized protein n=1 Tax=Candidatus Marsarchaeota G1 archaeon BE_D TaxID=1978156 RepID=A0A2R6AFB5_9ARCH|nr:MAG: hypothetical protein B9Q02_07970 [Candidatus Marsarchaeota G1 archaeon BE_D]